MKNQFDYKSLMKHITISGSIGSGKSTVAKCLKSLLGIKIKSIGSIQREMAQQYGMTTVEFNKYMETHPEFDDELDSFQRKEGEKNDTSIFDSRLAWHFVPNSLKVYLYVDEKTAAERIIKDNQRIGESYHSQQETILSIRQRRESELLRYKNKYNIVLDDLNNYDLIIDTSSVSAQEVARLIAKVYGNEDSPSVKIWMSPFSLLPTQSIRQNSIGSVNEISPFFREINDYLRNPIKVLYDDNVFYIFDGHKRTINAVLNRYNLIPCSQSYILPKGMTVAQYVNDNYSQKIENDWNCMIETIKDINKE